MIKNIFRKRQGIESLNGSDYGVLAIGLVAFTTISLWTIAKSSIWFDEAFGAYLIRFNFLDVARYTATDVHPPLYYWLLKLWSYLFGTNEFALRSMSTLFAAIAIVFGFLLVKRLFGRKPAWISLVFMVLSPMVVRYSQEMRMYALAAAIVLAATYVLTIAMESKKRMPWVVYGILVSLGMWTHYFTALVWIAHWVWRVWVVRQEKSKKEKFLPRFFSKEWILAHIVAVGLFLPWLPSFIHQVLDVQVHGFWIPPVTSDTLPNFFTNVLYYQDQETVNPWMTLLFMVIVTTIIALAVRLYRTQNAEQRQKYMLIFTIGFVPIVILVLLSMPPLQSAFIDRYLVPSTVGIALFIGVTLALATAQIIRPRLKMILGVVIAGAMVFGIANVYILGNYNKTLHTSNNTRQAIEAITAKAKSGEPIVTDSPWLFYEAVFYSTPEHQVYFINANTDYRYSSLDMLRLNDQHKIKDLSAFAAQHTTVWYLGRPGNGTLGVPDPSWKPLQQVGVNDSVSNQPAYKAVEYQTK